MVAQLSKVTYKEGNKWWGLSKDSTDKALIIIPSANNGIESTIDDHI